MSIALSITEYQIFVVLRSFLLLILPDGIEVVRGQDNRVPEPEGDDFVTMTPLFQERLATNIDLYIGDAATKTVEQYTQITIQLDVHGPASSDNAQTISTLFRDEYAAQQFAISGLDMAPLYTSDPRQVPFINGEQQYETRYTIDVVLQANPVLTLPQQFADELGPAIIYDVI